MFDIIAVIGLALVFFVSAVLWCWIILAGIAALLERGSYVRRADLVDNAGLALILPLGVVMAAVHLWLFVYFVGGFYDPIA